MSSKSGQDRPNEAYWQTHLKWYEEEQARRRDLMPTYIIQEAFLSDYFARCGKVKSLEFGCGFGRFLRLLSKLPNVDMHGVDISPESLECISTWAEPAWLREHITLISPRQRLPYENDAFDIVFTVSVLIHVTPEDVRSLMAELVRITRGHILHLENPVTDRPKKITDYHGGCWAHPLVDHYKELGVECEVFPNHNTRQSFYRAIIDKTVPLPEVNPLVAESLHELDERVSKSNDYTERSRVIVKAMDDLRSEVAKVNQHLREEIGRLLDDIRADIQSVRSEVGNQNEAIRSEVAKANQQLREEVANVLAGLWSRRLRRALARVLGVFRPRRE